MKTTSGTIYYGMHFYPGVAQYDENADRPIKIFLNESVLRKMDPTFAGKPIFVEHVDEVDPRLDEVRKEADGWVVESFFNSVDGKHWVKMVIVSERGKSAINEGYRLSNAYLPKLSGKSGIWNNIQYDDEVVDGEYEHLAIVSNPRYAESIILTPDQFKKHNENLKIELERIANSKKEESFFMKLKFWNRKPVENITDFENLFVTLPKCGRELSISMLVNEMDEHEEKKKENMHESGHPMADKGHMVKLHDGTMCNVGELVKKFGEMHESLKNRDQEVEGGLDTEPQKLDVEGDLKNEKGDENYEMDDKEAREKALELARHEEEEIKADEKKDKKKNSSTHFNTLKDAPLKVQNTDTEVDLPMDKVARGKLRYGSN